MRALITSPSPAASRHPLPASRGEGQRVDLLPARAENVAERRMRGLMKIAISSALLFATACVSGSDIQKLQSQISDLQDQVAALKRTASSKEEVQNVNTKIAEQTQTLLKSNATLVTKVDSIEERLNNAQGSVEQTNYRVDRMVQQLTQTQHDVEDLKAAAVAARAATPAPGTTTPGNPPMNEVTVQPPATSSESPVETYQTA